CHQWSSYPSTF
nr:immunoglobulin light chain junction region [Mus musculus]